jgi:hypothetical protein
MDFLLSKVNLYKVFIGKEEVIKIEKIIIINQQANHWLNV